MGYRKNMACPPRWQALQWYCILLILLASVSCTNTKKAVYFSDQRNGSFEAPAIPKLVIQNNDLLSISVSSLNPEASAVFNQPNNPPTGNNNNTSTTTAATGYLVDGEGNIQFPFLGAVKAAGLSKDELKDNLTKSLVDKKLLVDPIITIRFLNFKV